MTETIESPETSEAAIDEALARIDEELSRVLHRDLVSSSEVTDLLLDVRRILRTSDKVPAASA